MAQVIDIESAKKEVVEFLKDNDADHLIPDATATTEKELEQKKEFEKNILMLAKDISAGRLVIKDGIATKELKFKLPDLHTGEIFLASVSFDKRLTAKDKDDIIAKVKKDDTGSAMDAIKAIIAKKVGLDVAIINKIDSRDYKILQAIGTIFF